jgi:hypothetical protein
MGDRPVCVLWISTLVGKGEHVSASLEMIVRRSELVGLEAWKHIHNTLAQKLHQGSDSIQLDDEPLHTSHSRLLHLKDAYLCKISTVEFR